MTSAIAIEDVRREVKMLKALSGHKNLVKFYDAFEDVNNVYIVMEYVQKKIFVNIPLCPARTYSYLVHCLIYVRTFFKLLVIKEPISLLIK